MRISSQEYWHITAILSDVSLDQKHGFTKATVREVSHAKVKYESSTRMMIRVRHDLNLRRVAVSKVVLLPDRASNPCSSMKQHGVGRNLVCRSQRATAHLHMLSSCDLSGLIACRSLACTKRIQGPCVGFEVNEENIHTFHKTPSVYSAVC